MTDRSSRDCPREPLLERRSSVVTIALLAIVAAIAAVATGCSSQAASTPPMPPPEVSVAPVRVQTLRPWDEFTGRVVAVEHVELRPRVSGYVQRVAYDEGQEVRKGDLLFVIDPRPYRTALQRAQAQLSRARSEAQLARTQDARAQALVEARAISREEFEARRAASAQGDAEVRAAESAVAAARLDLQFTEVRSPIDGRAGRALATVGNLARADTTLLTTVVSQDPVHVHFEADEQSFLRYVAQARQGARTAAGTPVRVGLANEDGFPHDGVLDFIDNLVDAATGTIRARAVLRNPDRAFTPGLFARVQLQAGAEFEAMLVDPAAVLTDQDRKYVYTLGPGDIAVRKDVVVGRQVVPPGSTSSRAFQIVESGLEPNDRVIVHGVQKVFMPGMPVAPTTIAMGAPPAAPASSQPPQVAAAPAAD